jgi:NAD(P)-dependent dehydrogenase (short-subunit alcohol dehydrogenase family)
MDTQRFKDKVCIITGGGSGIGRATALRMAAEGARVALADRSDGPAQETAGLIEKAGGQAMAVHCDVGVAKDIADCVKTVVEKWGRLDVVVSNAAMMTFTPIVDLNLEDWDQLMRVNLRALFLFTKYALPHMSNGAIVAVSSVHAHQTTPNVIPYASSKGAEEAFIRGCSLEYPREKARFIAVAPGAVDTPMLWSNPNIKSGAEKVTGVVGTPDELAAAIAFVASGEASYINGTTLVVDGGRLAAL